MDLADGDPSVLIIGAGHCGLDTAAQLRQLGVSTLAIEKNARVGDNVRAFCSLRSIGGCNELTYVEVVEKAVRLTVLA